MVFFLFNHLADYGCCFHLGGCFLVVIGHGQGKNLNIVAYINISCSEKKSGYRNDRIKG